ncbi:hypothetical protein SDC9_107974 [bioreactor metagenome]|uniref:Uncharacterized protein n=1 Tax=bioreactor metagenome TaxID=1076179 RepID=A0A645B6R1_9ZZZZ
MPVAGGDSSDITMDQHGISGFGRDEVRRPAPVILMHEPADSSLADVLLKISVIILDIVIEAVLLDDDRIEAVQITGTRVIDFLDRQLQFVA